MKLFSIVTHTLLGSVSHAPCLLWARGAWCAMGGGQLAVLPAAHTQQVAQHITLLLPVDLLHVLISSHCDELPEKHNRGNVAAALNTLQFLN